MLVLSIVHALVSTQKKRAEKAVNEQRRRANVSNSMRQFSLRARRGFECLPAPLPDGPPPVVIFIVEPLGIFLGELLGVFRTDPLGILIVEPLGIFINGTAKTFNFDPLGICILG